MTRAGPDPSPGQREGSEGGLQGDGLGDPQTDLRCAQQVGLHRRARVSHSSMASGWRVKGSWGEEDRPSNLREGPPLTSWAQAWWGQGLTWPAESCLLVPGCPPLGLLYPSGPCGPPSRRKEPRGQQGAGKSWWGGLLGESPEPSLGEAPGYAVFIVLAPQPTQIQGDNDRYFTLTSGFLFWALALDLDLQRWGRYPRALPS